MIKYKYIKETIDKEYIDKTYCDYCEREFKDSTSYGEVFFSFGWTSQFDSEELNLHICDECFLKHFGKQLEKQLKEKGLTSSVKELHSNNVIDNINIGMSKQLIDNMFNNIEEKQKKMSLIKVIMNKDKEELE